MSKNYSKLKNIAVVAHVDHGKTTMVDCLLRQSGTFEARAEMTDRVMDSGEIERERGITITAKTTIIIISARSIILPIPIQKPRSSIKAPWGVAPLNILPHR